MEFLTEQKVREEQSLDVILNVLSKKIESSIKDLNCQKYCMGYHLRHVFDMNPSPIGLLSSNIKLARQIRRHTTSMGLHTLNHVLDSLYYPRTLTEDLFLCMRVSYCMQENDCGESFYEVPQGGLKLWERSIRPKIENEVNRLRELVPQDINLKHVKMGARWENNPIDLRDISNANLNISEIMFGGSGGATRFYEEYLCGTQKLCSKLEIEPSLVTYRSIMAAIYQLGRYADNMAFGPETITFMLRPKDHFGFVLGLTVITDKLLTIQELKPIIYKLLDYYSILKKPYSGFSKDDIKKLGGGKQQLMKIDKFRGLEFDSNIPVDQKISLYIAKNILRVAPVEREQGPKPLDFVFKTISEENEEGTLVRTVESFLKIVTAFCDEKLEGRPLRFGIMLAHPFLMRYWPGPYPLAMKQHVTNSNSQEFFKVNELAKQVHLAEGPEERCLVIPYLEYKFDKNYALPAYTLELSDFEESLSSWSKGAIWDHEFRPYAYLTERYPWAVAAIVGPGSEIRVFVQGKLRVYRDGKGWKQYGNPMDEIATHSPQWLANGSKYKLLEVMIDVALQLSPIARRNAHGGLLVYAPAKTSQRRFWNSEGSKMEILHDTEPVRADSRYNWLTGLSIIKEMKSHNLSIMDPAVAQLVLRAGSLDGAVVFADPNGCIKYFGRRLTNQEQTTIKAKGTKRVTAAAFVEGLKKTYNYDHGLGIAISSDGPIRIYTYDVNTEAARETVLFEGY